MLAKVRLTQEKKLFNLGMRTAAETNDPEKKVIFNFSDRTLSPAEKSLLAKGLNLSIPPKKLNYGDLGVSPILVFNIGRYRYIGRFIGPIPIYRPINRADTDIYI